MAKEILAQPVFDPANPMDSLDYLEASLPLSSMYRFGHVDGSSPSRKWGDGSEIRDIRDYEFGDDTRHIDHRQSAMSTDGTLQVRDYNRDIKPNLWVVTDTLQSSFEAASALSEYYSKQKLGLAAALAVLVIANQQGVPSTLIGANNTDIQTFSKLKRGRNHLADLADEAATAISIEADRSHLLLAGPESVVERPRFKELLAYAGERCNGGIVVLVSDFKDEGPDSWQEDLERLKDNNNQLFALHISSPTDAKLPSKKRRFATEQGVAVIARGRLGQRQRRAYEAVSAARSEAVDNVLHHVEAHHIKLETSDPVWTDSLIDQLDLIQA